MQLHLKGSLFDLETIGTVEVDESSPPDVGAVIECSGKSYTITDLIREDPAVHGLPPVDGEAVIVLIAIVEPFAVSQRRGSKSG
jgi:hypothetical protein